MAGNQPLGAFLRSRRTRLDPAALGLPAGRRRRTAGLKREEVAQAAGISAEWYVKLEQGRAVQPSEATIEALGQALRLDGPERRHLRALAGLAPRPAGAQAPFVRESVPEALRALVGRLAEPAYVTGQRWDVLAWNGAACDLLADFAAVAEPERNILLWMLADPAARALFGPGWAGEAQRMVSLFRASYDLWAGDAAFEALLDRLRAGCPEFEGWWTRHAVAAPVAGSKTLHHPRRGPLRWDHASFQANDDPRLKLALYVVG